MSPQIQCATSVAEIEVGLTFPVGSIVTDCDLVYEVIGYSLSDHGDILLKVRVCNVPEMNIKIEIPIHNLERV